jgi:transposase-like protein
MATKRPLDDILAAIEGSNGNVSIVARKLSVSRQTIYSYLKQYRTAQEALDDERAKIADVIESTLMREALGNPEKKIAPNITALIFVAKAHPEMRKRGWREGADVRISGHIDVSKLPDDELERLARGEGGG